MMGLMKSALLFIQQCPMKMEWRKHLLAKAGVKFVDIRAKCSIGANVCFDRVCPDKITIGRGVCITEGCKILTHYMDPSKPSPPFSYRLDNVFIDDGVFIGVNTLIVNSVRIGKNAVIGAGSVVTKDIPDNEIWAGNPARFIRKREYELEQ